MDARQELRTSEYDFRSTIRSGALKNKRPKNRKPQSLPGEKLMYRVMPVLFIVACTLIWARAQSWM